MSVRTMLRKAYDWTGRTFALTDPAPWQQLLGSGSYAGKSVTEVSAMQTSAVWTCVRILAETIGQLPWGIYERDGNGNMTRVDHPLGEVLTMSPNADMTDVEYREAKVVNLALQGNGYSIIQRNAARTRIQSLYPVPAAHTRPERAPDGSIVYRISDGPARGVYPASEIWHVKGFGSTGLVGYSPIGCLREAIGLALATEEFGARFFGQGATVTGFLSHPDWLNEKQRQTAREVINQKYTGLGNAHKLMLLEGGMKFDGSATMPLEDAQFMLLRGFQILEICRIYRMPPHLAGEMSHATFTNIEHQGAEFVTYTLMPWLTRVEASANRYLFQPGERGRYQLKFNVDALLRGDSLARSRYLATLLQNGVITRNQARAKENLNHADAPGMDDYTVQSNMAFIDALDDLIDQRMGARGVADPGTDNNAPAGAGDSR